ncbi:subtilisin-like protein [Lactarius hengduanensis]|nr:subtilisin-like protein [Lactarius hengduanensis]
MRRILISVLFVLSIATPIAALWDNMRVKHAWTAISANWECLAQPGGPPAILGMQDTSSPPTLAHICTHVFYCRYGAHHSKEQVAELIALSLDTLELVNCWLKHHGVSPSSISRTHGGGWLMVSGVPVSRANEMLGASYQLYWHAGTNTIAPTTHFASMGTLQQTPPTRFDGAAASLGEGASGEPKDVSRRDVRVTPMFLRVLYGTVKYEPAATDRNVLGVTGYLGHDTSFKVEQVNGGGDNPNDPGDEANLNIRVTQGITYPVQHVFYSSAGPPPFNSDGSWSTNSNEPYLDWIIYITSKGPIPLTITTSYGDDEQTVPKDYAKSVCTLFARFGQRGVSVLFASGDSVSAEVITWPTTTREKTASSPSFPYPTATLSQVPGRWLLKLFSARGVPVTAFLEKLGDTYDGLYDPWDRRTVDQLPDRPSRVTFGHGGHKLLSAHASFPSLPLLPEPSILGHPADRSLTDGGECGLAAE